jgi:zinc transport system substrate-binding protein
MRTAGLILMSGLLVASCSKREEPVGTTRTPVVYTVNYPLAYFAERIAGDTVDVVFPEMDGDPAFWAPTAEAVSKYQDADLILLNGASYAKWVPKVSLPQRNLVDTSAGMQPLFIGIDGSVTHAHGPGGAHAHGELAFTLWLDMEMAARQAGVIYEQFAARWSISEDGYEALVGDLKKLDGELDEAFSKLKNQPILGSHPVYQYLARRYDLNMKSVHWEPDAKPDTQMWQELNDILEAHDAKIMLWDEAPLPAVKEALVQKGIVSIVFSPCGNHPETGDYMTVMQQNLNALSHL